MLGSIKVETLKIVPISNFGSRMMGITWRNIFVVLEIENVDLTHKNCNFEPTI